MAIKSSTIRRYEVIRTEFVKLIGTREFGVQKYTTKFILHKLAAKFYLSPGTLENFVFYRVGKVEEGVEPGVDLFSDQQ